MGIYTVRNAQITEVPQYRENKVGFFKKNFKLHKNSLCNKYAHPYAFTRKYCTERKGEVGHQTSSKAETLKNANVNTRQTVQIITSENK
jgi:hypothetical protein